MTLCRNKKVCFTSKARPFQLVFLVASCICRYAMMPTIPAGGQGGGSPYHAEYIFSPVRGLCVHVSCMNALFFFMNIRLPGKTSPLQNSFG